jgi:hypothetical protein
MRSLSGIVVANMDGVPQAVKSLFYSAMGTSAAMVNGHYNLTGMSRAVLSVTGALLERFRHAPGAAAVQDPEDEETAPEEEEEGGHPVLASPAKRPRIRQAGSNTTDEDD